MNDQNHLILIAKIVQGDIDAFGELVDAYKDLAITLAYNIVLDKHDAEDIVQDSFIKAYQSLKSFKGKSKFSTWFYRIVLNTALNKKKLKKPVLKFESEDNEENNFAGIGNDLYNFNYNDQRKYITQAIATLNEGERVCISMYYLQELSIAEIHEVTGFSESNIKVHLYRGRKQLYNQLFHLLKSELKDLL